MNPEFLMLILVAALAAVAVVLAGLGWRAAIAAPARLQLVLDKVLAGNRAEAEFLRANLAAVEGRLTTAIQTGTTDALSKAFAQIGTATQSVADHRGCAAPPGGGGFPKDHPAPGDASGRRSRPR